jgi:hypothetical protein
LVFQAVAAVLEIKQQAEQVGEVYLLVAAAVLAVLAAHTQVVQADLAALLLVARVEFQAAAVVLVI